MFRFTKNPFLIINPLSTKSSQIAIRPNLSEAKLAPTKDYRPVFVHRLNNRYDHVTDQNRFESLNLILKKMSNHVGRRQYAMQQEMSQFLEKFKAVGLDWHELQTLPSDHLSYILDREIGMTPSQKRIFMTAIHARVCGVLIETSAGSKPRAVCLNRGLAEHGYRCGKKGHVGLCYFEGKLSRSPSSIAVSALAGDHQQQIRSSENKSDGDSSTNTAKNDNKNSSSSIPIPVVQAEFVQEIDQQQAQKDPSESKSNDKHETEFSSSSSATKLRVSTQPDFRIVGRLFHESHPRAWSAPTVASFDIATIGYDFYLHPSDPRAEPQIVQAASEWELHAEALRNVIWELLEHHAIERTHPSSPLILPAQPFDVARGDVRSEKDVLDVLKSYYSTIDPETGIIIENVMMKDDIIGGNRTNSSSSSSIVTTPWFLPSEPRPIDETTGTPIHFPISPSIAIQCLYRAPSDVDRFYPNSTESAIQQQQKRLVEAPYLEFRMFGHKSLCFSWPTAEVRKSAVAEILEVARRVPFALPFTLYFRVDSCQIMERNNGELRKLRDERIEAKKKFFDLELYRQVWSNPFEFVDEKGAERKKEDKETEEVKMNNDVGEKEELTQEQQELENLVKSLNPDGWE